MSRIVGSWMCMISRYDPTCLLFAACGTNRIRRRYVPSFNYFNLLCRSSYFIRTYTFLHCTEDHIISTRLPSERNGFWDRKYITLKTQEEHVRVLSCLEGVKRIKIRDG